MAKAIRKVCVAYAMLCVLCPMAWPQPPSEPGPFDVAEFYERLVDAERGREFDTLLLLPMPHADADPPEHGFPLIVLCHGFLLRGEFYRSYGEHLASHGFAVVLPTFPTSLLGVDHPALAMDIRYVINHYLDADMDLKSPFFGAFDASKIGTCGHSLGGKLALLEAVNDVRVGAIGLLDPVDGGGPGNEDPDRYPSVAPELMGRIDVPLLLIGAELGSVTHVFTPCAPASENYQQFYDAANRPALEVTQLGAGHGQYVDTTAAALVAACAPGIVDADWVRSSSAAYLTAFFQWRLQGEDDARRWLDERLEADVHEDRIVVRRK